MSPGPSTSCVIPVPLSHAQASGDARSGNFHRYFQLPGGRGTVHVISSRPVMGPAGPGTAGMECANPGADTMRDMILNALMETGLALPDGILMSEG